MLGKLRLNLNKHVVVALDVMIQSVTANNKRRVLIYDLVPSVSFGCPSSINPKMVFRRGDKRVLCLTLTGSGGSNSVLRMWACHSKNQFFPMSSLFFADTCVLDLGKTFP